MMHFNRNIRRGLAGLVSLCMLAQPVLAATHPEASRPPITRGHIKNAQAGWHVYAVAPDGALLAATRTDAEGRFVFEGLPEESYAGYAIEVRDVNQVAVVLPPDAIVMENNSGDGVRIGAPTPTPAPTSTLTSTALAPSDARITGTVVAEDTGLPLASVLVYAYDSRTSLLPIRSAFTLSNGQYVLDSLPSGGYFVQFRTDTSGQAANYIGEYYNNKPDLVTADEVTVGSTDVTGINVQLTRGGVITGVVRSAQSNQPILSAQVYLYTSTVQSTANDIAIDFTDSSGVYEVRALPAGTYYLRAEAPYDGNYLSAYFNHKSSLASADPIAVTLGNTATADMALQVGGVISGSVRSSQTNLPIQSALVYLYTNTQSPSYSYLKVGVTDMNGIHLFKSLPAGSYYLRIEPPYRRNLLYEYFNDKPSLAAADALTVTLGNTVTADVALQVGGVITGRVTGSGTGLPLADISVWLLGPGLEETDICGDAVPLRFVDIQTTDANGVYTFTALTAAHYIIQFYPGSKSLYFPEYYDDKPTREAATPISVTLGITVSNINAALQLGGAITGRVTADDTGEGLPDVWVDAYRQNGATSSYASYDSTDANGYYTITRLAAGNHFLNIYPFSGNAYRSHPYVREAYNNRKFNEFVDPVSVTLGSITGNINVGLARGGQITGYVMAEDTGQPLEDVNIYLVQGSKFLYGGETDANGLYTTTGAPSGDYTVHFYTRFTDNVTTSNYLEEYYNNQPSASTALSVAVTAPNLTPNINAQLARGGMITGFVNITGGITADIAVSAFFATSNSTFPVKDTTSDRTTGHYALRGLPTSAYHVQFGPLCTKTTKYAPIWYRQKPDKASAASVQVAAPNTTANITATVGGGVEPEPSVTPTPTATPVPTVTPVSSKKYFYLPVVLR